MQSTAIALGVGVVLGLLLAGAQVLAYPRPELGAGGGAALAEVHEVATAGHALDLHLAEGAALTGARGDRSHGSHAQNGQLKAIAAEAGLCFVCFS